MTTCVCVLMAGMTLQDIVQDSVYMLMEHASKVVVDMAVVDKRETGGNSNVMEKEGLRRLLEKMASVLPVSELATDASSSIMKLVHDMKGMLMLIANFHLKHLISQVLNPFILSVWNGYP